MKFKINDDLTNDTLYILDKMFFMCSLFVFGITFLNVIPFIYALYIHTQISTVQLVQYIVMVIMLLSMETFNIFNDCYKVPTKTAFILSTIITVFIAISFALYIIYIYPTLI